MSVFIKFRLLFIAGVSFVISACVTLPGHRQTIDEENFFLNITAPTLAIKNEIRFNSEKTELLFLPKGAQLEFVVSDNLGKHQLSVQKHQETIVYNYRLNGQKMTFGVNEKEWFASQIPIIIDKIGLKYGQG
ncbi:hypothetical protein WG68_05350 [Arsukibacterium ikkense]|uniref:Lipoprotein n=1 Tax=Arsukibacterium ikkense TaxID=336831 RepID=A0A0M2V7A0_9GAMM|nr:hypothetical protein [Arsukibacterium ikkense]KKO46707.1 hypothetical protein WG68_05350 [Arsukibacterium ikkense]